MDIILFTAFLISFSFACTFIYLYLACLKSHKAHQQMQNDFLAVMIHDLRSPLSVIKSSADLLLKEAQNLSQDQIFELLKQTEDSTSDLLGTVNNLLDVSKIEAGKIELFKKEMDLNKFLVGEAEEYANLARQKGLEIVVNLDKEVKSLNCDAEKLRHITNNLLSNSIKFTESGHITIETLGFKKYVQISISDTGAGIPDDMKVKLFSKYTQALAHKTKEKGTGLGLVIVKGIVEVHGGRIWIENNTPQGTKFIFTLPK